MKDKILGTLPDLLTFNDGSKVETKEDWSKRRQEISDIAVGICYGGIPPEPEYFDLDLLCNSHDKVYSYKITAGTAEKQLSFLLKIYRPEITGKVPVIIDGDECWGEMTHEIINEILAHGYAVALFNRTEIVKDVRESRDSALFKVYPEIESSTIAGWAWGSMRVVDALCKIDFIDAENIAVTGHSRGGKAAQLAGAYDTRIQFVCPNGSGAGGAGCWHYLMQEPEEWLNPTDDRSEVLKDLFNAFPYWMGPAMRQYIDKDGEIPFDQHFFKAMVAPRYYIQTEGLSDTWANPKGSLQTFLASKEVFKLLDAEDHAQIRYRAGDHAHDLADFNMILNVMDHKIKGTPLSEEFQYNPFPDMELIF